MPSRVVRQCNTVETRRLQGPGPAARFPRQGPGWHTPTAAAGRAGLAPRRSLAGSPAACALAWRDCGGSAAQQSAGRLCFWAADLVCVLAACRQVGSNAASDRGSLACWQARSRLAAGTTKSFLPCALVLVLSPVRLGGQASADGHAMCPPCPPSNCLQASSCTASWQSC